MARNTVRSGSLDRSLAGVIPHNDVVWANGRASARMRQIDHLGVIAPLPVRHRSGTTCRLGRHRHE
jgi:hypothetical protein